ncbi:hypothetical protein [Halorussus sp. MSC15.2]|uniref:hypothetical protein n=1 Tax=Halorussus sp. MSC15.2 TaxID=2283638 RepID=UPI0013D05229|nr:hypothetical protein [Halorussus sp. MSC15.2]NEU55294.1 hypothetical protein [Halorussus sp. MSC15.2]
MSEGGTDSDDEQSGGEQSGGKQDGDEQSGGEQGGDEQRPAPSTAEKVLTGVSVLVTVLVFGYVAWHAVQPPSHVPPEAHVVETETLSNGSVLVRAKLVNRGDTGLISATVEVGCDQPQPSTSLSYVPAGGRSEATFVCPQGTTRPNATVTTWVPA